MILNYARSLSKKQGGLILFLAVFAGLSLLGFIFVSSRTYRIGFPLDDAWIHQTYARNLGLNGEWAFIPGQPSAGSTAPLWSVLLSIGYLLGLNAYAWAFFLGWVLLWLIAVFGAYKFQVLVPLKSGWSIWVGILLTLEWHLVWAAGSGMETLMFSLLILLALTWFSRGVGNWFVLGLLIGLSVWVRPDGITLLGPAGLVILSTKVTVRERARLILELLIGILVLFVPYLLFNRALAGAWWPNTFFAKQAEYALHRQIPLLQRFFEQARLPLIGVGAVLLPGFGLALWHAFQRRRWGVFAGGIWVIGYLGLYAWRLPVTYQHGRYIIPAMLIYFVYGSAGLAEWVQPGAEHVWKRVLGKTWLLTAGLVLVAFWFLGARSYAQDVRFIESEMVATAQWIADNTPVDSLVAAHDIGALGYFSHRRLLDLAGLVSPEVIPFIRDQNQLALFLDNQGANYLVTFPGWYPQLVSRAQQIYKSPGVSGVDTGYDDMAVYSWPGN